MLTDQPVRNPLVLPYRQCERIYGIFFPFCRKRAVLGGNRKSRYSKRREKTIVEKTGLREHTCSMHVRSTHAYKQERVLRGRAVLSNARYTVHCAPRPVKSDTVYAPADGASTTVNDDFARVNRRQQCRTTIHTPPVWSARGTSTTRLNVCVRRR